VQVLSEAASNGDLEDFYSHFASLGYNKHMELDEGCRVQLTVSCEKKNVLKHVDVLCFMKDETSHAIQEVIKRYGTSSFVVNGITLYEYLEDNFAAFLVASVKVG
jgi:hypothetical protein